MTSTDAAPAGDPPEQEQEPEPVPVGGCDVCEALAEQRESARAAGRTDRVRACNAELWNHVRAAASR